MLLRIINDSRRKIWKKKKILIVDDDKDLVNATKTILESGNFKVVSAYNREEGLKMVKKEMPCGYC